MNRWLDVEELYAERKAAIEAEMAQAQEGGDGAPPMNAQGQDLDERLTDLDNSHQQELRLFLRELFQTCAAISQLCEHIGESGVNEAVLFHAQCLIQAAHVAADCTNQGGAIERAQMLTLALDTHGSALRPALLYQEHGVNAYDALAVKGREMRDQTDEAD